MFIVCDLVYFHSFFVQFFSGISNFSIPSSLVAETSKMHNFVHPRSLKISFQCCLKLITGCFKISVSLCVHYWCVCKSHDFLVVCAAYYAAQTTKNFFSFSLNFFSFSLNFDVPIQDLQRTFSAFAVTTAISARTPHSIRHCMNLLTVIRY